MDAQHFRLKFLSVHPSIVQHAPPPYYPSGMENKGLEHSMDLALDEQGKPMNVVGPTYNGYHTPNQTPGEWMTMGYMTNSYSNSNNGGSVNSQDSLWQMKMASAHHNQQQAPQSDTRSQYGAYDPLTHGGYGVLDDYAQYRGGGNTPDAYSNAPPSRQDFGPPDKRLRQLYQDSPYQQHDVSGLPDPYLDHAPHHESEESLKSPVLPHPPHHLSYDENLESGFSTPSSRNRRIIREIIV
uniref:Uncharacterized protein n=1 Tax=Cacopsylla melanoneura TaxID=428564 RepID=A0A8D8SJH2_9HEMI